MITGQGIIPLSKETRTEHYIVRRGSYMFIIKAVKRVNVVTAPPPTDWFELGSSRTTTVSYDDIRPLIGRDEVVRTPTGYSTFVDPDTMYLRREPARDQSVDATYEYCQFIFRRHEGESPVASMTRFDDESEEEFKTRFHEILDLLAPHNNVNTIQTMQYEDYPLSR